jgi:hypothetical protein
MTIINDNSRVVNKLEASLTDDARVVIYDRHMFIVQATELKLKAMHQQQHKLRQKSCMKFPIDQLMLRELERALLKDELR